MHIVFIVSNYYPNYSAVGKCVGNVADVLGKSHKITVICERNKNKENIEEIYNNQRIIRVLTKEKNLRLKIESKINESENFKKKVHQILYNLYKSKVVANILLSKTSLKNELVLKYIDALNNIKEPIDIIIPTCMPFEGVLAAAKFKKKHKKNIKIIPYLFDQFVENESLHRIKLNKEIKKKSHSNIEMKIIEEVDSLMILKQLKPYYIENYKEFMSKFRVVEHPLLMKPNINIKSNDKSDLSFIYAGSFYRNIRNPEYMLNVFDKILTEKKGKLSLYTFGNCKDIISNYTVKNKNINDFGKVDTEKVQEELFQHDFLIAVGNSDNKQVPSKIFEYISYGKPIIYFYTNKYDANLNVLNKYNLAICIEQNTDYIKENVYGILEFCKRNIDKKLPYNDVVNQFKDATPEYTANIINELIKE